MLVRIHVAVKPHVTDTPGRKAAASVKSALGLAVDSARIVKVFTVQGLDDAQIALAMERGALHDPVLHDVSLAPLARDFDWLIEVGFRPGVTDNEGRTARETLAVVLGLSREQAGRLAVYTSTQYLLAGGLTAREARRIATDLLANELIQRFEIRSAAEGPDIAPRAAEVHAEGVSEVATIDIFAMSDGELLEFSKANTLALSLAELHAIKAYYARPGVRESRAAMGLPPLPTDAEIEMLAQTWSEHCKHKIFNARITYRDEDAGTEEVVDSLFKTCIAGSTREVRAAKGENDLCLSVFKDNAGVFKFTDEVAACVKMETHNSPSALDPYGGALTGIVGVNRDPMGTGMGAELLCNTDVFCFASPFFEGELPPRLLHPRRVLEGVREGVEHGGNKSGVPTVNGSIVFDERFLGKPLVYCGTLGALPVMQHGRPAYEKYHKPGDAVVMVGGRIGKDGIHGATFSSEELHEGSPATAVQIGDPITQRKAYDFLMRARDLGLYSAITDNGAGGLSSSVGEMAGQTGGARIDLSKAPLKYPGLRPWEVLLSEAQERMSLAVPQDKLPEFLRLAGEMDVEASVLGEFTDSGYFHATWGETPVCCLDMDFLHDGVPQMELSAAWKTPRCEASGLPEVADQGGLLRTMLGCLNICSKEYVVRQYDHEVQGGSAIKPFVGVKLDGPADAGVIRPVLGLERGLAVSHGICPKFSDFDTYWMMAGAMDEAVRNAVAVGADPDQMVGVDNFCWCDPVQSEKTPDGAYKLAQLVRANRALAHFAKAFGVPCISGKDSMKNDYTGGGTKISIPPTVLFSAVGIVPDVNKCLTSDFKRPDERIYLLGATWDELAGSELWQELKLAGGNVPHVDALSALSRYRAVFKAAQAGLISAAHDCSDGGLAVALAEMALGGRLGCSVDLAAVPQAGGGLVDLVLLYAESHSRLLVTVPENRAEEFERLFNGQILGLLGRTGGHEVRIGRQGRALLSEPVEALARAFCGTLAW